LKAGGGGDPEMKRICFALSLCTREVKGVHMTGFKKQLTAAITLIPWLEGPFLSINIPRVEFLIISRSSLTLSA
jgi:hypothetical protein